jgi:hypothetical protein
MTVICPTKKVFVCDTLFLRDSPDKYTSNHLIRIILTKEFNQHYELLSHIKFCGKSVCLDTQYSDQIPGALQLLGENLREIKEFTLKVTDVNPTGNVIQFAKLANVLANSEHLRVLKISYPEISDDIFWTLLDGLSLNRSIIILSLTALTVSQHHLLMERLEYHPTIATVISEHSTEAFSQVGAIAKRIQRKFCGIE